MVATSFVKKSASAVSITWDVSQKPVQVFAMAPFPLHILRIMRLAKLFVRTCSNVEMELSKTLRKKLIKR